MTFLQKFYRLSFPVRFFLFGAPPVLMVPLLPLGWARPPLQELGPHLAIGVLLLSLVLAVVFSITAAMQLREMNHRDAGPCVAGYVFGLAVLLMMSILWANLLTGAIVPDRKGIVWGYVCIFGGMGLLLVTMTFVRVGWYWYRSPRSCTC